MEPFACALHTALILQTLKTVATRPHKADIVLLLFAIWCRIIPYFKYSVLWTIQRWSANLVESKET